MKTVLITGAAGGIGSAIARKFASNGYNVALHYNTSEAKALSLAAELCAVGANTITVKANLTSREEISLMFQKVYACFGNIDVLVNNAGVSVVKLFQDVTEEEFKNISDVNLAAAYYCCQEIAKKQLDRGGSIVNISSMWGITGASMEVAYSATKAGVIGLTKALAKELAPQGITVNCIAPGAVKTPMLDMYDEQTLTGIAQSIPLMRLGKTEEIADAVFFIATAAYVTGQVLAVDGGMTI